MLDYYNLSTMLSTDELQIQSSARNYLESEISPHVSRWWEDGEFPEEKIPSEPKYVDSDFPGDSDLDLDSDSDLNLDF